MAPARSFGTNIGPMRTRPSPVDLSTTAEYHHSLRGQSRQSDSERYPEDPQPHDDWAKKSTTRRWIPVRPKTSDSITRVKRSAGKRDIIIDSPLQLSRRQVEEFETLPIAVRRKYFSTLERLRFAQTSGALDDSPQLGDFYNSPRSFTFSNDTASRRNNGQGAGDFTPPDLGSRLQTSIHQTQAASTDCLPSGVALPISSERHLTREQQVALAKSLRESVILDAADEAIYKIGRRASRHLSPSGNAHTLSPTQSSMETQESRVTNAQVHQPEALDAFYDSFRWLDGDDNLDLSLQLDDHHSNLKENLERPSTDNRPSFRRHLSISRMSFGRPSISTGRPGTHGGISIPTSPTSSSLAQPVHSRRKSRTLSLINTRHTPQPSTSSIDPAAAHYQDPEARAKLRVYLASPQKFDEAVEFGFPSHDAFPAHSTPGTQMSRGHSRQMLSQDSSKFKTFLSDDRSSVYSDDLSLSDPESPKTPQSPDRATARPGGDLDSSELALFGKNSDAYAQLPVASREMTLRMTLTRPDLRACEEQIYGWQKGVEQHTNKLAKVSPAHGDLPPPKKTHVGDNSKPKESFEAFFASLDDEEEEAAADNGVVKRFWNKMRRS
ncbi:hypothetical protein BKA67DRAFT_664314 [Truncatella angustata]|uniref:Mucin n=1 Tax=Truncatella angustata TaxID=152316 RepID=A0A9P8RI61_9PEZI|nr:uncharacterized protein BKA67DRAFT_664314 [Truncatella angustata]KAH6646478.1 hypothetical protein BKA67DRAFT_664314 [Truncatella angustata]KAH8194936.1 hypothetical protein TruAng_010901 [Truncatella angustata]